MTFKELTEQFYNDDITNNKLIDQLIYFLSKTIKDKANLIVSKNIEIDFELDNFLYYYDLVFIKQKPIEYITKKVTFLGIDYSIDDGVFIPRNDTEFIVDWILESKILDNITNVLDLCTGSGVIANTLKFFNKNLNVYGCDKSLKAVSVSKYNSKLYELNNKFFWKDVFKLKKDFLINFELIVCNPPYIDKNFPLDISVKKYEPKLALYANDNGLLFYKRYISQIYPLLQKNTKTIFEIGFDQKDALEKYLLDQNINNFYFLKDLNKNFRILIIDKF